MIYKQVKLENVMIRAGQVIGAPVDTQPIMTLPGTADDAVAKIKWRYVGAEWRVGGRGALARRFRSEGSPVKYWSVGVTNTTYVVLKGHFKFPPLAMVEAKSYRNDDGNVTVVPESHAIRPVAYWHVTDSDKGETVRGSYHNPLESRTAYVLLQDACFSGIAELHNSVDDRSEPFRWPLYVGQQSYFTTPGYWPEVGFAGTDMHDSEELLAYIRAWQHFPGDAKSIHENVPILDPDSLSIPHGLRPPDPGTTQFWSYLPICMPQVWANVVLLNQEVGPTFPVKLLPAAADDLPINAHLTPLSSGGVSMMEIAHQWLGQYPGDSGSAYSGIALWFEMVGDSRVRVAMPFSSLYLEEAFKADTWAFDLIKRETINTAPLVFGPAIGIDAAGLSETASIVQLNLWEPSPVQPNATVNDSYDPAPATFVLLRDADFFSGLAYSLMASSYKGDPDVKLEWGAPGLYRLDQAVTAAEDANKETPGEGK